MSEEGILTLLEGDCFDEEQNLIKFKNGKPVLVTGLDNPLESSLAKAYELCSRGCSSSC